MKKESDSFIRKCVITILLIPTFVGINSINLFSQSGIISTVIGSGVYGFSGDGGPATNAELSNSFGIAFDDSANIYIADALSNNRIRKVSAKTGFITTIAGNGASGYLGDGGPATLARLNSPGAIAIDRNYNVFFSDCVNNVIREVTYSTGIINTVAGNGYKPHLHGYPPDWGDYSGDGGPATDAELNGPCGIVIDDSNNFYIADAWNHIIRKVSFSSGIIYRIAGNAYGASVYPDISGYSGDGGPATAAELNKATQILLNKLGDLYISDSYNNVVREVNTNGIINTIAGNNSNGFGYSGDGGPATMAEFDYTGSITIDKYGNLFIGDGNDVVRFVDNSTGIISTIAGNKSFGYGYSGDGGPATLAEFSYPEGVIVDSIGDLYISDGNRVVRKVTTPILTGVKKNTENDDIAVFPNPAKNEITIQLLVSPQARVGQSITFYDLTGREVLTQKLTKATTTIDCAGLSEGAYLYKISNEKGEVIKADKIVVER